ncbi:MAG: hypothetical protein HS111_04600 [Kofleriaceae bacterium]|nr:hypothetical protein [Kofleriaceae bacterium]MCL4228379.1 hypothetical protein [Myxococcales bacterium]
MTKRSVVQLAVVVLGACGDGGDGGGGPDAAPPVRDVTASATVAAGGLSEEVTFDVPAATRSVTVVVTGADGALYALGALRTPDGVDRVMLPAGDPGPAMAMAYHVEQIGQMPGDLYQSIRLGTFTHVYPYRPGPALTAGRASLRVASDTPGPVQVRVLMAPDDGARTLHLNVILVSDVLSIDDLPSFLDEVQALLAPAGIDVVVDRVVTVAGTPLENLTESTEPQEAPGSMSAMLPGLVAGLVAGPALDLFIVESLPAGIGGLSLGTPGPPVRGGYYFGVIVRTSANDGQLARVIAHEVCHFLALQHVQNLGVSGTVYPDPLDDTLPGQDNLMERGTRLTADQAFALGRSWLLQP